MNLTSGIVWAAYLVSAILFILSLSGLSNQESARRGNVFGIAGMALAIGATILGNTLENYPLVIAMMLLGGTIGVMVSMRVQMTAMPQLVALLHSLVGLAAVMIGVANQLGSDTTAAFAGVEKTIH
ncbi:MAG: NAD(P)(+) transhydrogenase (Re/Si-specific) subunit beta, partial [Arenicellales bacterium]|nr:NAD(P)(+) transhydrogenase (Re/Si-specific) subunit beta [Arenicellales bacterium]